MITTIDNIIEIREELKSLFEYSLDFLFIYDFEGQILDVNEIVIKTLEYSKKEILEKTIFDFVSEEDMSDALAALNRLKERGRVARYNVFKIKKKNGGYLYLEVSGIPFKLKNNTPVVLGIGHDITLLKETEKELKNSEKKYRSLFNDSPIGIMLFDMEGNLIDKNSTAIKRFPELFGINLTNKNFIEILSLFPNSNQLIEIFVERLRALRKGQELKPFEFFIDTKDGRRIWVSWQSSHVKIDSETYIQVLVQNITERKETEKNLIDSEQKFHVLFNNSTSGIAYHKLIYDTNGTPIDYIISDVNPQYERILSLKKEDVINKKATEVYEVESAPYINIYSKVASTQKSISFEAHFPPLDKYFKISVISPKEGEFITVFDDISEQKKAENVVKLERDKLQALMDGLTRAEIGIDIVDINYTVLFQNQFLADRFGSLSKEYCHEKYLGLTQPCEFCPMEKAIKDNTVESTELIGSDGRGYEIISAPLLNPDGTIDKAIEVVLDITNRKRAEQSLKESEEKFRTITEQSFLGIIIIQDNHIKYANEAMAKITEFSTEELVGMSMDYLEEKIFHPEDTPILREEFTPYSTYRAFTKSGKVKWIEDYTKVILYQGREAFLVSIMDITEKKEAEKLIIEENKKLLELDEMRRDMITRISHELKTPLTSIYGAIQILSESLRDQMNENILKFIDVIHRGSIRFKKLIDNLLDISRLESKKWELKIQKEDLAEVVNDCVNEMIYLAHNRNLKINLNLPNELYFEVDKLRLEQAITNLISNAIKNTPMNGIISVSLLNSIDYIDIKIEDTGVGLTHDEMMKLFKKFGKIERYGMDLDVDIEGIGLGLFISKEIVELHGGRILVESEGRNLGSTFTIRLFKN